jgi:hypothetical protein
VGREGVGDGVGLGEGGTAGVGLGELEGGAAREDGIGFEDDGVWLGESSARGAAGLGDDGGGEFSASRNVRRRVLLRASCRSC